MWEFNQCLSVDKRMYAVDLQGSKAYAKALSQTSPPILTAHELTAIVDGLSAVQLEWEDGSFLIKPDDEDIHTANERRLSEIIGNEIGGKLHTGRSRNDQVATDMRLWLLQELDQDIDWIKNLIQAIVGRAEEWQDHLAAGFTHLQVSLVVRVDIATTLTQFRSERNRFDSLISSSPTPIPSPAISIVYRTFVR